MLAAGVAAVLAVLSVATAVREAESRPKHDPIAARVPILVVGDSLEVGTGPYLEERLGERVEVFARRGRPSTEGLQVLRKRLRKRHGVVVFDLGSNDRDPWILRRNMREARRLVRPRRCMVVATINPDRREPLNEVIRRIAERPNVVLFDWQRLTKRRPELLTEDGVHATPEGYGVRARQLIRAIRRCPVMGQRR